RRWPAVSRRRRRSSRARRPARTSSRPRAWRRGSVPARRWPRSSSTPASAISAPTWSAPEDATEQSRAGPFLFPGSRPLDNGSSHHVARHGTNAPIGARLLASRGPAMPDTLSVLCVHGIGHGDVDSELAPSWSAAVTEQIRRFRPDLAVTFEFFRYDDL